MQQTTFRFAHLLAIWIVATYAYGLFAAGTEMTPQASFTYVIVLNDQARGDGSPASGQPDISALGGEVLHRLGNRRVIRISESGVRALAAHRGVKYVQRIQVDDSLPPLPQAARLATTAVATNSSPSPTWYSGLYVYDGDGNITAIGTAANQSSDGGSESYTYDSASRLVQGVIDHGTTDTEKYTYDSFGNLVDTTRTASPSTPTPTSPATNRLTGVTYDAVGNTITAGGSMTYVWDGLNMLRAEVKSTETATYVYTADDERVGVFENGEQRWMIRDLSNKVLREWEATGSVWMWREDHMYRSGSLAAAEREPAEGGTRHFHIDHLGTPRLITDGNAQKISAHDYYPFGIEKSDFTQEITERGTTRPESMGFTGHERDYTGGTGSNHRNYLYYMHARYYNSVSGRFLSTDPVWNSADSTSPMTWNRYTYVRNNPVRYVDPDGRKDKAPTAEERLATRVIGTETPVDKNHKENPANCKAYNCHSYVWHGGADGSGDPTDPLNKDSSFLPLWDHDPMDDVEEQGFKKIGNNVPNEPGDRILYGFDFNKNGYLDGRNEVQHSALVVAVDRQGNTVTAQSKWGDDAIYLHHPRAVPENYGTMKEYYRYVPKRTK